MQRRTETSSSILDPIDVDLEEEKSASPLNRHGRVVPRHEPRDDSDDAVTSPRKLGLPFILNEQPSLTERTPAVSVAVDDAPFVLTRQINASCSITGGTNKSPPSASSPVAHEGRPPTAVGVLASAPSPRPASGSAAARKRGRTCRFEGCDNYIVQKGLCCRHGGGKKCSVDGCDSSAKHGGRCWKHGGSIKCKIPECKSKAKTRGLCWAHGGGAKCHTEGCTKVAITNGACWAHGGGKRCIFDGCQRPAFERTHSFCLRHYEELQGVDYFEV